VKINNTHLEQHQISTIRKKIITHSGAVWSSDKWKCVCGFDLELIEQPGDFVSQKEVVEKWAAHLAERISSRR
jgi:hypothetical protein